MGPIDLGHRHVPCRGDARSSDILSVTNRVSQDRALVEFSISLLFSAMLPDVFSQGFKAEAKAKAAQFVIFHWWLPLRYFAKKIGQITKK